MFEDGTDAAFSLDSIDLTIYTIPTSTSFISCTPDCNEGLLWSPELLFNHSLLTWEVRCYIFVLFWEAQLPLTVHVL